jgi:hypothetical protein
MLLRRHQGKHGRVPSWRRLAQNAQQASDRGAGDSGWPGRTCARRSLASRTR